MIEVIHMRIDSLVFTRVFTLINIIQISDLHCILYNNELYNIKDKRYKTNVIIALGILFFYKIYLF